MSLMEDLKKEIERKESSMFYPSDVSFARSMLSDKVLSGWYGTAIMLDYLDYLGGDSVEFVRKQQEKGIGKS